LTPDKTLPLSKQNPHPPKLNALQPKRKLRAIQYKNYAASYLAAQKHATLPYNPQQTSSL